MVHGAADIVQGVGNTYYAIKGEDKEMPNFVQEGYKAAGRTVGRLIGGEKGAQIGEKIGSGAFFVADTALSFVSGKAILDGAKVAKQGTTFFKGTQQVLKATGKNIATNVKWAFKAVKELPGKVKDTGSNVVKKFSSLFVKDSKVTNQALDAASELNKVLQNPSAIDPYELLRQRGVTTTFNKEEVELSRVLDLRMQATTKKIKTDFVVSPNGVVEPVADGQHILQKHVSKTDAELLARIQKQTSISGASTFTDDIVANDVINQVMNNASNQTKINNWLASGAKKNLPLNYKGNAVVGRSIQQGSTALTDVKDVTNAKVILKKNSKKSSGYDILTAYPE